MRLPLLCTCTTACSCSSVCQNYVIFMVATAVLAIRSQVQAHGNTGLYAPLCRSALQTPLVQPTSTYS